LQGTVIEPDALDQPRLVTGQDCRSADFLAEGFALPLEICLGAIDRFIRESEGIYMPLAVAAKKDAMASTPTQGPFMTEVSSTGFGAKAAANSFVPFLPTMAAQSSPGLRRALSIDIAALELEASDDQAVASRKCLDGADEVASKISFAVSSGLLFLTSPVPQINRAKLKSACPWLQCRRCRYFGRDERRADFAA
jgi:hypothetical protein